MKKLLLAFVLVAGLASMVMTDAEARRLGGGSFGRQSSNIGRIAPMQRNMAQPGQQAQQGQRAANPSQAANAPRPARRWGGILGGALLGLGLGALLGHFGISGGMANMISTVLMLIIIVYVVRFLIRRFSGKRREQDANAYAGNYQNTGYTHSGIPEIGSALPHQFTGTATGMQDANVGNDNWGIPADFDVPAFLRAAKSYFIRMQAAWDKGDINDIHEFTTPEMFAEIRLQLQERGTAPNVTDVVSLDAELLGIETLSHEYMASVKFSGKIREAEGAAPEPFEEVWNLTRPISKKDGWVLAGIQQLS